MHQIFQSFADCLSSASDADGLRDALAKAADALELSCFAYLAITHKQASVPKLISNYPSAWTEHYLQSHYERVDPVIIRALGNPEPFKWGLGVEAIVQTEVQCRLFDEAAHFGIRNGFTIPIHDSCGLVAAVTFAADAGRPQFERCISEHARVLQLMAIYFHAHARHSFRPERMIDGVSLSPREFECLEWAAQGKSFWEIGRILGISRHTVASYLDSAKEKLGVRTIVQAATRLAAAK
jgi:DNA-binding CsgD family transcriptional regulator